MTDQIKHTLIPPHEKISETEKKELYVKYNISFKELPKMSVKDPAIQHLEAKVGDVIRITRKSPTAGRAIFFRGVAND